MSQYDNVVERRKKMLEAEEWASGVKSIHFHKLTSMWYDDHPEDTDKGMVFDTEFNNGVIRREIKGGGVRIFGKELSGDELINEYERNNR